MAQDQLNRTSRNQNPVEPSAQSETTRAKTVQKTKIHKSNRRCPRSGVVAARCNVVVVVVVLVVVVAVVVVAVVVVAVVT